MLTNIRKNCIKYNHKLIKFEIIKYTNMFCTVVFGCFYFLINGNHCNLIL
jgi:hypothetical protein